MAIEFVHALNMISSVLTQLQFPLMSMEPICVPLCFSSPPLIHYNRTGGLLLLFSWLVYLVFFDEPLIFEVPFARNTWLRQEYKKLSKGQNSTETDNNIEKSKKKEDNFQWSHKS